LAGSRITLLTGGTFYRRKDAARYWIAAVVCTQISIVTDQRCTGLAIEYWITGFEAVADVVVVAGGVIRRVHTDIIDLVAGIHGAVNRVIAIGRRAG
jgi:hypothetical protein